ncbi:MAG: flagellar biosynthetic protein FliR [Synergistaceae bacterium]|jgi:flagellar biosynthetic protein FliR|nr:flagellar biosynthetic protein FliR [Synergistaceae bacterium]
MLPFLTNDAYVNIVLLHFMISVRILALLLSASVFLLPSIPNTVKFWLSVALSIIIVPVSEASIPSATLGSLYFLALMTLREFLIGAALGFISGIPLYALQTSGFIDGTLMGLNMMNMFDPASQSQVSVLAQMKYMLAIWFYLHWDGHILLLRALAESVRLVPVGISFWEDPVTAPWIEWMQDVFVIAMKISLPIFGAVLLAEVGLGFVARTVPQMNVFVLGIPLKIAIGLFVLLTVLPGTVDIFHGEIESAVSMALSGIRFLR